MCAANHDAISLPAQFVHLDYLSEPRSTLAARLSLLRKDVQLSEYEFTVGRGIGATLLFLAQHALWQLRGAVIYGGLVRDYVVRGHVDHEMDLDVFVEQTYRAAAEASLVKLCNQHSLKCKVTNKGPNVRIALSVIGSEITCNCEFMIV